MSCVNDLSEAPFRSGLQMPENRLGPGPIDGALKGPGPLSICGAIGGVIMGPGGGV